MLVIVSDCDVQPLPAYSGPGWLFCCVLDQPSEPTLLLRNSTTDPSASGGACYSSSPDYRVFFFCDETPLCPYKQSVAIWGGGWFLFQPNVIFSHLPHFLASHRNPPRWNAVGLTWVSGLRRVCILTGSQFRVASTWTALPFAFWILSAVLNYLFLKLKAKLEINHQQKDSNTLTPLDFIRMYECTRVFCRPGGNACMYLENYSNAHKEVSVKLGEAQDQTGACFIPVS